LGFLEREKEERRGEEGEKGEKYFHFFFNFRWLIISIYFRHIIVRARRNTHVAGDWKGRRRATINVLVENGAGNLLFAHIKNLVVVLHSYFCRIKCQNKKEL
jgi:hypothetical protein